MTTHRFSPTTLAFCFTCAAALLSPASRAAEEPAPTLLVRYADLDIGNPAGAHVLLRRIEAAARQVCSMDPASDRRLLGHDHRCFENAVDAAVRDVNSPLLTALHGTQSVQLASRSGENHE